MKSFGKFITEGSDIDWLAILNGTETVQEPETEVDPRIVRADAERKRYIQNLGINHTFPMLKHYGLTPEPIQKGMHPMYYPSGMFVTISYLSVPNDSFSHDLKFGKQAPRITPKKTVVDIDAAHAEKALEVGQHTPAKIVTRYLGFSAQQVSAILDVLSRLGK